MKEGSLSTRSGSRESIAEELVRIQLQQEELMRRKDQEVEELKRLVKQQQRDISLHEAEIRRLEREGHSQQEERTLDLGGFLPRSSGGLVNPYQGNGDSFISIARKICNPSLSSSSSRTPRQPWRLIDIFRGAILLVFILYFYNFSPMHSPLDSIDDHTTTTRTISYNREQVQAVKPKVKITIQLKPWESQPPKPITLMETKEPHVRHRHSCIQAVRNKHQQIFQKLLHPDMQVLLVDPAYHSNVGDHMLTIGELQLLQGSLSLQTPTQCHYVQANNFFDVCTDVIRGSDRDVTKVALWHAGGNWGDLWRDAQDVRIPSFKTILENGYSMIGLPQSLFYLDESLKGKDVKEIKEKVALGLGLAKQETIPLSNDDNKWDILPAKPVNTSALDTEKGMALAHKKVIFMWREKESFEEASQLYPFVRNMLVPDMAFQLGPYAPIRKASNKLVDIILFLRQDHESQVNSDRNEDSIRRMLPKPDMTFRIVDWSDRSKLLGATDMFFTDTSIELLSLGKVVICDRLHAAILAYLSGLPFVYIDQVSGKVTKTLTAAFGETEGCMDEEKSRWARATTLREALAKAYKMMDYPPPTPGHFSFLRSLIPY